MQALVKLGGRMHDTDFDDRGEADHYCQVIYRISLPVGKRAEFENLAGYKLTPIPKVGVEVTENGKFDEVYDDERSSGYY
jgi:hypothetical protein